MYHFENLKYRVVIINKAINDYMELKRKYELELQNVEESTNRLLRDFYEKNKAEEERIIMPFLHELDCIWNCINAIYGKIESYHFFLVNNIKEARHYEEIVKEKDFRNEFYYGSHFECLKFLENVYDEISKKVARYNEKKHGMLQSLFGNSGDDLEEIFTLIYKSYQYYKDIEKHFDGLMETKRLEISNLLSGKTKKLYEDADKECEALYEKYTANVEKWSTDFINRLDEALPVSYLKMLYQIYDRK